MSSDRVTPETRRKNPAAILPGACQAAQALHASAEDAGVPASTLALVHLRASQINGCSACVDSGSRAAKAAGETDERLFAVAAWRDAPHFTEAKRAALALAEAGHSPERPGRSGPQRDLGRGRSPLRREGSGCTRGLHRHDQRLQPSQRHYSPGGRNLELNESEQPAERNRTRSVSASRGPASVRDRRDRPVGVGLRASRSSGSLPSGLKFALCPRHHDRWSGAHLVQGRRRLTSGFSYPVPSEMRVSRVLFSGPYQPCIRMRMQGVRGEMWPVSCGFEPAGTLMSSPEAVLRVRA
jgi:AhpD family alkylhydroperoxidase